MTGVAISVEGLGKAYRIGRKEETYDTLLRSALSWLRAPLRNYERLRRLTRFHDDEDGSDVLWALRDVCFDVQAGEVLGVIGSNGAGKTTLLKVLSRITDPTRGRAVVRGRVSSLLEVGTGFHPELTGRENVFMNGTILGMRKREIAARFDRIVEFAGVSRFIDTPVKRYSSGMRVRLAFAVAAHLEPEILVIDEVLAVGDAAFQNRCVGKMGEVARGGRTVLFVSHNMSAVKALCTRCALLVDGRLAEVGEVAKVVGRYLGSASEVSYDVDLTQATTRTGDATRYLKRWRVTTASGRPLTHLRIGQDVTFHVTAASPRPEEDVHLGIRLLGPQGERLVTPHTRYEVGEGIILRGRVEFRYMLRDLRLLPGRYTVELDLTSHGHPLEYVQGGLALEVMADDLYGTGKLPPPRTGVMAPQGTWAIEECRDG